LALIDNNKCDYVYVVLGTQRDKKSDPIYRGSFYFEEGENDDIGRVLDRFRKSLFLLHPVFERSNE